MVKLKNPYAELLGIYEANVGKGKASIKVKTNEHHANKLGYIHGGFIYSVADIAFELASNSHGVDAVGITTTMQFHKAARVGDTIEAIAKEIHLGRKIATYNIEVLSEEKLLGTFVGTVYRFESTDQK
jgi:acyl-CoA thioesterase